jgi:hypothetical protein
MVDGFRVCGAVTVVKLVRSAWFNAVQRLTLCRQIDELDDRHRLGRGGTSARRRRPPCRGAARCLRTSELSLMGVEMSW